MTRGGRRNGAGRKPDSDAPRSVRCEIKLTPAQAWWLDHLATSAEMPRAAVLAAALDRAIAEHACSECSDESTPQVLPHEDCETPTTP